MHRARRVSSRPPIGIVTQAAWRAAALGLAVTAVVVALLAAPSFASAVPSARQVGGSSLTAGPVTLPHTTTIRPDGTVIQIASRDAIRAITPSATSGCGNACDGMSPEDFITPAGGPSFWYKCSWDASTVRSAGSSGFLLQLRYSPRCRTAWSLVSSPSASVTTNSYFLNGSFRTHTFTPGGQLRYTAMVNDAGLLAEARSNDGPTTWTTGRF
jgi:hypothetical protein